MTLARTALRLATVNALIGATVAQARVYDSKIGDFAPESFRDDAKPTIVVLTDKDEGAATSVQNGGPPFNRMADVVIEFAMVQAINQNVDEDGNDLPGPAEFVLIYPDTDPRHEAALDFLEFQIMRRLSTDLADAAALFRSFTRIVKFDCHRQVLEDGGMKIAARILTLTVDVMDDQIEIFTPFGAPVPTGVDVLPQPLRNVCKAMPDGSTGASVCAAITAALQPLTSERLEGVDLVYSLADGAPEVEAPINFDPPT